MASAQSTSAVTSFNALTPEEKKETADAITAMNSDLFPKDDASKVKVWLVMVIGAFVLAAIALFGAIFAPADADRSPYFVFATAIATGIIGLFVASPIQKK